MNVYGELIRAQLEVLSSNFSFGVKGRVGYNQTTKQAILDTGTAVVPLGSGGGTGVFFLLGDSNAPAPETLNGLDLLDFDYQSVQEVFALFKVPEGYGGTQIKLVGGVFAISAVAGNILFRTQTSLIRPGTTVLDTYTNQRTSTNTQVTAAAVASRITNIGDIDLTDTSGQINAVPVLAGDELLVRLYRDTANESVPSAADAKLLRTSFEVKTT